MRVAVAVQHAMKQKWPVEPVSAARMRGLNAREPRKGLGRALGCRSLACSTNKLSISSLPTKALHRAAGKRDTGLGTLSGLQGFPSMWRELGVQAGRRLTWHRRSSTPSVDENCVTVASCPEWRLCGAQMGRTVADLRAPPRRTSPSRRGVDEGNWEHSTQISHKSGRGIDRGSRERKPPQPGCPSQGPLSLCPQLTGPAAPIYVKGRELPNIPSPRVLYRPSPPLATAPEPRCAAKVAWAPGTRDRCVGCSLSTACVIGQPRAGCLRGWQDGEESREGVCPQAADKLCNSRPQVLLG